MSTSAPEPIKDEIIHLGLKRPDEPALMEDYYFYEPVPDLTDHVAEIEKNSEYYFNFGFNVGNYQSYMMKHIYMRMEKLKVKQTMDNKGGDMKNGISYRP